MGWQWKTEWFDSIQMGQSYMAYGTLGFFIGYMAVLAECKSWLVSAGSTNAALLAFFLVS